MRDLTDGLVPQPQFIDEAIPSTILLKIIHTTGIIYASAFMTPPTPFNAACNAAAVRTIAECL
jgi:hypothetical protein